MIAVGLAVAVAAASGLDPTTVEEWAGTGITAVGGMATAIALYRGLSDQLRTLAESVTALRSEVATIGRDVAVQAERLEATRTALREVDEELADIARQVREIDRVRASG